MIYRFVLIAFLLTCGSACSNDVKPGTLEHGWIWLARCIDTGRGEDVYRALDQKSQWSVQTIHKLVGMMKKIVEHRYPEEKKKGALGMWESMKNSSSPAHLFGVLLTQWGGLSRLREGFGAARRFNTSGNTAIVTAVSGRRFSFSRGSDGRWGLDIYRKKLDSLKISAQDHLKLIKQNAEAFDEARRGEGKDGH